MKKIKRIVTFALSILMITSFKVYAKDYTPPNVMLEGRSAGIVYIPGSAPFLSVDNMMPGDKVERNLEISNHYENPYELFLKVDKDSLIGDKDLADRLTLKVMEEDKVIYTGKLNGEDGLQDNVSLGVFENGDVSELEASVTLDGPNTTNSNRNEEIQVTWVFTAETDTENVKKVLNNTNDDTEDPGTNTIIRKIKRKLVQTFDGSNLLGLAGILLCSLGVIIISRRKFRKQGVVQDEKMEK